MNNATDRGEGKTLSFWKLFKLEDLDIEIPIIQRDYAQGRPNKIKIRQSFLRDLLKSLESDETIDLDFIYGKVDETNRFIPLDGQQRLTTLFLLHWYFAMVSDQSDLFRQYLTKENDQNGSYSNSRFYYRTRTSAREFCDQLAFYQLDIDLFSPEDNGKGGRISEIIRDQPWYFLSWDTDPSISGMLNMLDAIQDTFPINECYEYFNKLIDEHTPAITFQYLDLEKFDLTEDLYIKMNARGKQLTQFENFKARFLKYLSGCHPEKENEFSKKIDGIWLDLFWEFSKPTEGVKGKPSTDDKLINFLEFITEILFYKKLEKNGEEFDFSNFDLVERIYKEKGAIDFLMKSLDLLSTQKGEKHVQAIGKFFQEVFSSTFHEGRVNLFQPEINLFEESINRKQFDHPEKLLFYALLHYHIQLSYPTLTPSENLKDYLRICRNFLYKINQKGNSNSKNQYVSDLRTSYYHDIIRTFDLILDPEDVYAELNNKIGQFSFRLDNVKAENFKAQLITKNPEIKGFVHKLEDHQYLRGDLHLLHEILDEGKDLETFTNNFYKLFQKASDSLLIRSLLATGDYKVRVGNSNFGTLYFFGSKNRWNRVLTDRDDPARLGKVLRDFFVAINFWNEPVTEEKLRSHIQQRINNEEKNSNWVQLFLRYPSITQGGSGVFAFLLDDDTLYVEKLKGLSLRSQHVGMQIDAVMNSDKLKAKAKTDCWLSDSYDTYIPLKYSASMEPMGDFWYIDAKSQDYSKIKEDFNLKPDEEKNTYRLYSSRDKDMIEIAVDFLNYLHS